MDTIEHNKKAHNNVAKTYNIKHTEIYNEYEQNRLEELIKKIITYSWKKQPKVLDVWAGTWNLTNYFLKNNCFVTASDVSEKSLDFLKNRFNEFKNSLNTKIIDSENLPFEDNTFDITATYSVLHHIPDYLNTVNEMIRVTKPWGFIFIDHEANENKYNPDEILKEYNSLTKQTRFEHIIKLIETKELFTFDFIKTVFIKLFINKRYEREWDIHVWLDDKIEWNKIKLILEKNNCQIVEENNYLLYIPKISVREYLDYAKKCNDTKYLIIQKK